MAPGAGGTGPASGCAAYPRPTASSTRGPKRIRVTLASCHRDHDPQKNDAANLMALCQRCHIPHDKAEHLRRRRLTYLARRALGDLLRNRMG